MKSNTIAVELKLVVPGSSEEELDRLTRALRDELAEQPVERVELARSATKVLGAKAVDPVTLGALALAVMPSVLPKVVEALERWSTRNSHLTVELTLTEGDHIIHIKAPATRDGERQARRLLDEAKAAIAR